MTKKDDTIFIIHILDCIRNIEEYSKGLDEKSFLKNKIVQDAVLRNFEVIGEASKNISEEFKKLHQEIPWRKMAGMRDKLIHDYMGVDLFSVWAVIEQILPNLREGLEKINSKL